MEREQLVLYWARTFHQAFQLNQSGEMLMGRGCISLFNRTQMCSRFPGVWYAVLDFSPLPKLQRRRESSLVIGL